jgi:hypothetical protein
LTDVTAQLAQHGNHFTVWLSRCADLSFRPGAIGKGSFFATEGCTRAEEAEKKYIWDFHKNNSAN